MKSHYLIISSTGQAVIMDKLKSSGIDVIQSSSGLVCKTIAKLAELKELVGAEASQIHLLDSTSDLSPDIKKFISEG